jgi:hypothetical protein
MVSRSITGLHIEATKTPDLEDDLSQAAADLLIRLLMAESSKLCKGIPASQ